MKFFEKEEHTYRIKKALREQVVFAPQNLLNDPPFSRLDVVTCRNLLIYLEPEAQRRVLTLLHFALREGGYLFLGNAETLGYADTLFEVVSKRWRIYRRTGPAQRFAELPALAARMPEVRPAARAAAAPIVRPSTTTLIQAALLEELPPTAVVDANERIIYFQGDTAPFLQHPSGEATQNLLELVRVAFRPAARSALRQAVAEKRPITVETESGDDGSHVAITAAPLKHRHPTQHFRVSFQRMLVQASAKEAAASEYSAPGIAVGGMSPRGDPLLEEELRQVRAELQASVEAFEASTEELKASNEEVTSVNEELQSANEELETGKEELDLLDVSRMASGQLRLTPRDTPLAPAVEAAIEAVRPAAENRKIALQSELRVEVGSVHVDPESLIDSARGTLAPRAALGDWASGSRSPSSWSSCTGVRSQRTATERGAGPRLPFTCRSRGATPPRNKPSRPSLGAKPVS